MNYPLPMHPNAMNAAMAAVAAGKQGKFWSYHDKLFENQDKQTMADLVRYAMEMQARHHQVPSRHAGRSRARRKRPR
jgi:protein-disulfide isomerase